MTITVNYLSLGNYGDIKHSTSLSRCQLTVSDVKKRGSFLDVGLKMPARKNGLVTSPAWTNGSPPLCWHSTFALTSPASLVIAIISFILTPSPAAPLLDPASQGERETDSVCVRQKYSTACPSLVSHHKCHLMIMTLCIIGVDDSPQNTGGGSRTYLLVINLVLYCVIHVLHSLLCFLWCHFCLCFF